MLSKSCKKNKVGALASEVSNHMAVSLFISVEEKREKSNEYAIIEFTEKVNNYLFVRAWLGYHFVRPT